MTVSPMGWPKRKKDPISDRAKALQTEIEHLEKQIKDLSEQSAKSQPRLRSTALPRGPTIPKTAAPEAPPPPPSPTEQVFETLDHQRLQAPPEAINKALFNELGVRKYDLPGAWLRLKNFFRGAETPRQPFVKLLAAGNIQGLKPLRYEKRIARRRFVVFAIFLFMALWALIALILRR